MLVITYEDGDVVRLGVDVNGEAEVERSGRVRAMHVQRAGGGRRKVPDAPAVVHAGQRIVLDQASRDFRFGIGAKVWEETWDTNGGIVCAEVAWTEGRFAFEQDTCFGVFGDVNGDAWMNPEPRDIERARLASQAPAMARLLLELQSIDVDGTKTCLSCTRTPLGHASDCVLANVLREAGVLP